MIAELLSPRSAAGQVVNLPTLDQPSTSPDGVPLAPAHDRRNRARSRPASSIPRVDSGSASNRRVRSAIIQATAADHVAAYYFLKEVFGGPGRAEFKSTLDDPFYEPRDRLLLRRKGQIIAHAHLTHRAMQFGPVQVPVAGLDWLGVAEHCRGQGLGTHLLTGAEKEMARFGALVGLVRTRVPQFFRRTGWALCGRHSFCQANVHAVLARLSERGLRPGRHAKLHIRPWRRWEEGALVRVYNQNLANSFGPLERTLPYWQWLLRRHGFNQLYVALEGPDQWDLKETTTRIVGYIAIRGERIIELLTVPGRRKVAAELLARACGEALEHDRHSVELHAPGSSFLMGLFDEAGGWRQNLESDHGVVYMARLLDPVGLLRLFCGEFVRRAEAARLPRPLELGLSVEGYKYQIEVTREGASAEGERLGRSYLRLNLADCTRLLLGQLDWDRALGEGRVVPSTALAREVGPVLFPHVPLWRPPLDDLTA
jgi:predicted N-acetyltransferase YhbS